MFGGYVFQLLMTLDIIIDVLLAIGQGRQRALLILRRQVLPLYYETFESSG